MIYKDYLVQLHLRFFINYYLEYLSTFWNLCTIIGLSLKNGHVFLKKENLQIFQRASLIRNATLKQQTLLFLIKRIRRNGQRPKRTHAPVIKNIYTGKNQDPTLVPAPEMYFRNDTSNKVAARYINSHLESKAKRS